MRAIEEIYGKIKYNNDHIKEICLPKIEIDDAIDGIEISLLAIISEAYPVRSFLSITIATKVWYGMVVIFILIQT